MREQTMAKPASWALPLSVILSAWVQHGCGICTCQNAGAGTPGEALAAASLSPANPLAGNVSYDWKNVAILGGGFVSGIVFSPVERHLVYARTDVGGVYRWNQADKTWIPLTDEIGGKAENLGIESLALDPTDPNKVYLATGMYTQSWAGNGAMFRSSDRGNTWQKTDMPIKMGRQRGRSLDG